MYIPDLGFGVGGLPRGAGRGIIDSCGQYSESRAASTHGPSGDPGGTSIIRYIFATYCLNMEIGAVTRF